jgi:hypothetical protein
MAKFSAENQPSKERRGRGKSERNKILEAFKRAGKTEDGFYDLLVMKAHDPEDNFTFKEVLNRISPLNKAVAPTIEFDFPENAKPHEQASAVLKGVADGLIPPDIGSQFVGSISAMMKIQEVSEFDERLKAMESQVESSS